MAPEDPSDLALAIRRTEQAGLKVGLMLNRMRGQAGAYTVLPEAEDLVDDLHDLINHLLVVRTALNRIQGRTSNAQQEHRT